MTQCTLPDQTATCSPASCSNGVAKQASRCDGTGSCSPPSLNICGAYACGATDCLPSCSTINDCSVKALCSAGQCLFDTQPPVVTFTLPLYTNHLVDLTAQATDNGVLTSAQIHINGTAAPAPLFDPTTGVITESQLPLKEGANTVLVQATDRASNVGGSQVVVNLDTVAPAITVASPTSGAAVGGLLVQTTISIADASPTTVTVGGQSFSLPAGGGPVSATVQMPGAGNQTLVVGAQDAAGNTQTLSVPVLVDLNAPTIDVDVPNGAAFGPLPGNLLPVTVHVNDVAATTVTVGGASYAVARGGGVVQAAIPVQEGSNPLSVQVTSETGKTASLTEIVIYDVTPPIASVTIPSEESYNRGVIEFSMNATDALTGVAAVQFEVDDGTPSSAQGGTGQPWTLLFDTKQLADGPHVLTSIATDGVGNTTTLHTNFTVDNTIPTVQIMQPTAGAFLRASVSIQVTANDAGGVASISISANGKAVGSCLDTPTCTLSYDTTTDPDGTRVITVVAVDRAGNSSEPTSISFVAVNNIPSGFVVSPTPGQLVRGTLPVAVSVADPYFQSVECFVDGTSLGVSTNPSFTQTVSILDKLDGPVTVLCTLRDLAGNVSTQSVTATIKTWTETLDPNTLNLKANGATVTMNVDGPSLSLLMPAEQHALSLVVPGGSPVAFSSGSNASLNNARLSLKFDRSQLSSSILAGIAAGAIDPSATLTIHLYSGSRDMGGASVTIKGAP
jgi:hypothetical protein